MSIAHHPFRPNVRLREGDSSLTPHTSQLLEREYSAAERTAMAKTGEAMSDGSFPIKTVADIENAKRLWGHSENPKEAKDHIIKRAAALGAEDKLPYNWHSKGSDYSATEARREEREAREGASHSSLLPALSSSDLRFMETDSADVRADPSRHILEVTLIRAGTSRNGNNYPAHVLREAVPLFEGCRAFADHQAHDDLPERSVRDLVGSYKNVHLDEAGRLRGELHLVPGNDWLYNLLVEAEGNPDLCGLSIDAWGKEDPNGAKGIRHVSQITRVMSCDIVTRPSAGGSVDRLIQSDRNVPLNSPKEITVDPEELKRQAEAEKARSAGAATPTLTQPTAPASDLAQLLEQLTQDRDRMRQELERVTSILSPSAPQAHPGEAANQQIVQLAEELRRERDQARAESLLQAKLSEAQLPPPVEAKMRKQFSGRLFEASALEEAITDEKNTLAQLTSAGIITGMGFEKPVTVGMSEYDQIQAAMDKLFDITESDAAKSVPAFAGIREAYRICTGADIGNRGGADGRLLEPFANGLRAKVMRGNLSESESILREADVTTASFSYLLGTSMNKRLLADYQAWPSEWQKFSTIVPVKDFKQQDRVRLGAFGSLSTVAEDAAYTTLTVADTRAIYTASKRGNLVQITRETIVNDDLYAIKQIPQKLAVAAAFTLAEFVYNLMAPGGAAIYDTHPLFDSINHKNTAILAASLATANSGSALSSAALETAVIAMRKQTNLAGKPIGLKPRFLVVPPDLEFTAMTILKSAGLPGGNNNDINPMMGYAEPIVSPQLNALASGPATTSAWIAVADPRVIDTIEVGFVGGQANPVLLIQDAPMYGLNFTQDTISYKVRHEYGGAVVDYRGFYLGNN